MSKNKKIIYVLLVLFGFITVLIYSTKSPKVEQTLDTKAYNEFEPWNISIVADTQSHNPDFYDDVYTSIKPYEPRMMLHLGDYVFYDETIRKVINNLRADTKEKYGVPMEFHGTTGNHDDSEKYPQYGLKDTMRNSICWQATFSLNKPGDLGVGISRPVDNEALNPEVQKLPYYCVPEGYTLVREDIPYTYPEGSMFQQYYSFERAGIKFITANHKFYDYPRQFNWLKEEVCKETTANSIIIITHSPPGEYYGDWNTPVTRAWKEITAMPCANKLKVVFGGHRHIFWHDNFNGVEMIVSSGMFYGEIGPGHPEYNEPWPSISDHWIATVHPKKIDFKRFVWNGKRFEDKGIIFSIKGDFSEYKHPEQLKNIPFNISYKLTPGTNIIGVPIEISGLTATKLHQEIKDIGGEIKNLSKYKNGKQIIFNPNKMNTDSDNNFDILAGDSIIIFAENKFNLELNGKVSEKQQTNFQVGWNLISWMDMQKREYTASDLINEYEKHGIYIEAISVFKDSRYTTYLKKDNIAYGKDLSLKPSDGVWILVKERDNKNSTSPDKDEGSEIDFKKCSTDSDCVLIKEGCCPCANSGTQIAINKKYTNEWEEQLNCSDEIVCATMYNCNPDISPACINGSCEIK